MYDASLSLFNESNAFPLTNSIIFELLRWFPTIHATFYQNLTKISEEMIEMKGVVHEVLPDSRYRVTLENGHSLIAYTAGKMRLHRIRIIEGDKVTVELSPYDMNKARVTFRHIEGKGPGPAVKRRF